jgi:hypothetical protein
VLSDGCAAFKPEVHHHALADMGTLAEVMPCESFIDQLHAKK